MRGPRIARANAFSLVEVAIALGIVSFCLVALMGLMSVGLQASKSAKQDTTLAMASQYVLATMRSQAFPPASQTFTFDYQGVPPSLSGQPKFYTCAVKVIQNPVASVYPWDAVNSNLVGIQMVFTWAGQAQTTGRNAEVFNATLSSY